MARYSLCTTLTVAAIATLCSSQLLRNPGFEGNPNLWNFNEIVNNGGSIQFENNQQRARFGNKLAVIRVNAGTVFPVRVRLGQEDLTLQRGKRYVYSVVVRVDNGLRNSGLPGGRRGAIVSAFCERGDNFVDTAFTGRDVTIAQAPRGAGGSYRKDVYRRVDFVIAGDGRSNWRCWVGMFAQPFDIRDPVELSVDAFKLTETGSLPVSSSSGPNVILDAAFANPLKTAGYFPHQRFKFRFGPGWYREKYLQGALPSITGDVLRLAISAGTASESLSGVVQKIELQAGQTYHMCVNYVRVTPNRPPNNTPTNQDFTTFNFFVRRPQAINDSVIPRRTQGLLLGRVDVQVFETSSGTSTVKFVAPATSTNYEVVLRLNRYANELINGQHVMTFTNPRIVPIASVNANGC